MVGYIKDVSWMAWRYWDFRDELSISDGLFLKELRLAIPGVLQEEYLHNLHEGHLSASKVQENARQHIYWPGIPRMYQEVPLMSYVLFCDYFLKFHFMFKAKTSFLSLRDHLINLFATEGYPDEIMLDNGPPFNSRKFAKLLSSLDIKPRSNGFTERHVQMVKIFLQRLKLGPLRKYLQI